jgi:predicted NBD/HSP70 family sugar kinase
MRGQPDYLAIDIGGTKTLLGVFDSDGLLIFEHKTPTNPDYEKFIKDIGVALSTELKDYEFSRCCCAAPGEIDHLRGAVRYSGNLAWHGVPLKADLEKLMPKTFVEVENDAKLAGLSEALLVQDKYKKVLYLTISTGIGGGIIINGKIDTDALDFEPGQMLLEHGGNLAKWESFASGKALAARYGKLASEIDDPEIWRGFARDIALGLDPLLAVIQPDVVILGGGVGAHYEKFSGFLDGELAKVKNDMVKIPPILKAQRPEEAVIYGCYALIQQAL